MINRLDVKNLRSFAGEKSVPLAPLTLIYGPNSVGKSSLIKALGLLKQTLGPAGVFSQVERPPLVLEGAIVDFGGFRNVIHRHDEGRELAIGIEFGDPDTAGRSIYAGLGFIRGELGEARQSTAELGGDDQRVSFVRSDEAERFELNPKDAKPLLELIRATAAERGGLDGSVAESMAEKLATELAAGRTMRFMPSGFFPALPEPGFLEINSQADKQFGAWFADTMYGRVGALDELLGSLAYLGPLRAAPARFQQLSRSGERSTEVGPTGEHVVRLLAERDGKGAVLKEVNEWLRRLGIAYELDVHQVKAANTGGSEIEVGDLYATALIDPKGTVVTPQDVGFGISQLLPVVVQMLANAKAVVCVEQPEIHIHPRLQSRVADLLLASIAPAGANNQVIVETHSEHLLLRIQRRLANRGMRGDLDPELEPALGDLSWLTPDQVSVVYVDASDGGYAHPRRLHLGDDGDFVEGDEWPGGFFDERYEDIMRRPARESRRSPLRKQARS